MVLAIKVKRRWAEEAHAILKDSGALITGYNIERDVDYVYFPVMPGESLDRAASELKGKEIEFGLIEMNFKRSKDDCKTKLAVDVIGDIAIVDPRNLSEGELKKEAEKFLKCHKQIKSVRKKATAVEGEFRVRKSELLAGDDKTETTHKENGILLNLDVDKVYFSPRLSTERARIASLVKPKENVAVLFAGVGPYSILIGKKCPTCKIISVELNDIASKYAEKNTLLNNVENVKIIEGDVRNLLKDEKWEKWADRIIMPLPKDVVEFFDVAYYLAKDHAMVHAYVFASGEDDAIKKIKAAIKKLGKEIEVLYAKACGSYSATISRWVVDFRFKE